MPAHLVPSPWSAVRMPGFRRSHLCFSQRHRIQICSIVSSMTLSAIATRIKSWISPELVMLGFSRLCFPSVFSGFATTPSSGFNLLLNRYDSLSPLVGYVRTANLAGACSKTTMMTRRSCWRHGAKFKAHVDDETMGILRRGRRWLARGVHCMVARASFREGGKRVLSRISVYFPLCGPGEITVLGICMYV